MKKTLILSIILLITLFLPMLGKSTVTFDPLELHITMENKFIQGNTSRNITIINNNNYSINTTWYIENPNPASYLRPNRTLIPDLSWVHVEPKWMTIPPSDIGKFYIFLYIPENKEILDKHWEVWVTFQLDDNDAGGEIFEREYAIRVYIDTPLEVANNNSFLNSNSNNYNYNLYYIIIGATITTLIALAIVFYKKKKK